MMEATMTAASDMLPGSLDEDSGRWRMDQPQLRRRVSLVSEVPGYMPGTLCIGDPGQTMATIVASSGPVAK